MLPFSPQPRSLPPQQVMARRHKIPLGGIDFEPHLSGALFAPEFRTLLVADLHLEQGVSLARRGIHAPPFDTSITLQELQRVIADYEPGKLIFLGDTFHDRIAHTELTEEHRAKLLNLTSEIEITWISGNHDPDPIENLGGRCVDEYKLGPVTLRHEPSRGKFKACEIAGHLHPGATIVQRGVAARGKCFIADANRIIMPAFGSYTGALGVTTPAFAKLFDVESARIWMTGKTAIHAFPLGRVN